MLTQDAFSEHKADYIIYRKTPVMDIYNNETNQFVAGGKVYCMWTPIADQASIQEYGEKVSTMMQAVIYEDTAIDAHDQVELDSERYEVVSIKRYPSYRLVQVAKI